MVAFMLEENRWSLDVLLRSTYGVTSHLIVGDLGMPQGRETRLTIFFPIVVPSSVACFIKKGNSMSRRESWPATGIPELHRVFRRDTVACTRLPSYMRGKSFSSN
jgi:hypothetical protein